MVLPGGIGTLEEAVEMLSWRRLDLHTKPIVFLSEDDFWAPFFHLIQHTVEANLTPASFADAVCQHAFAGGLLRGAGGGVAIGGQAQ